MINSRRTISSALFAALLVVSGLWLWACATPQDEAPPGQPPAESDNVYPHGEDFVLATQHGVFALSEGGASCRECHGADLRGGWSGVSCGQCHAIPDLPGL
ncbi:MAG: hypothetical protein P9L99_16310 [Candidatus Lernaella stagnicola]|nr:hypothetical protein [Candidatus Lernaella stagnicola]